MKKLHVTAVFLLVAIVFTCLSGFGSASLYVDSLRGSASASGEKLTQTSEIVTGNTVTVSGDSDLILRDASGLQIYAEENTSFSLDDSGLVLHSGGIIIVPEQGSAASLELSAGAGKVIASDAVFRVQLFMLSEEAYTLIEVFNGTVQVGIPEIGQQAELASGKALLIHNADARFVSQGELNVSEWLYGEMVTFLSGEDGDGNIFLPIPYEKLPYSARSALLEAKEAGYSLPISHDVLLRFLGTGHSYTQETLSAPLCAADGLCRYTCELCGETYTVNVDALGHDVQVVPGKEPTCTEEGFTDSTVCTRCGEILEPALVLPTVDHAPSENTVVSTSYADNSTCYSLLRSCRFCGVILERENISHITDVEIRTESDTGCYQVVLVCTECRMELDSHTVDHVIIETTEPSANGETVVTTGTCKECGKVIYVSANAVN